MQQYETFGQVLSRLMKSKGYTVKELTNLMSLKSSNTIARLLADKSGPKKIHSFCNELIELNPLQLVDKEKNELLEAANVSSIGLNHYAANKNILYLVREHPPTQTCVCKQAYGTSSSFITTLDDLFDSYAAFENVSITLQNCALHSVTNSIKSLLEKTTSTKITVEHYIDTSEDKVRETRDFANLLNVIGHPNYSFSFSPHSSLKENDFSNVYNNLIVALKCDKNGNKFTDVVAFQSEDSFIVLFNTPGEHSYAFHQQQFNALRQQHNPVKENFEGRHDINGLITYGRLMLDMDQNFPLISIRPDISPCMIPPDIAKTTLMPLLKNGSIDNSASYEEYMSILTKRHELFLAQKRPHRFLFSRSGICNFYNNGKSKSNVFGVRDLTIDERKKVIQLMIEIGKTSNITSFHLLKNELRYNNVPYLLFGNHHLSIDNYPNFQNYDPSKSYNFCWIKNAYIIGAFENFARDELIPDYAHSNKETIEFLESLL